MGVFSKKKCCNCGASVKTCNSVSLSGNLMLCKKCSSIISPNWYECAEEWDLDDFGFFVDYMNLEEDRMSKFTKTHEYGNLMVDVVHGLFYINEGIFKQKPADDVIYDMRYVLGLNFDFLPEKYKEGALSKHVTGVCVLKLVLAVPQIEIKYEIDCAMRCKLKKPGIYFAKIDDITFPNEWSEFYNIFLATIMAFRGVESGNRSGNKNDYNNDYNNDLELTKALATFMFSDISEVTMETLKHQRNKLIKAFHTDNGEENERYAQKINNAYNVIKKRIT